MEGSLPFLIALAAIVAELVVVVVVVAPEAVAELVVVVAVAAIEIVVAGCGPSLEGGPLAL